MGRAFSLRNRVPAKRAVADQGLWVINQGRQIQKFGTRLKCTATMNGGFVEPEMTTEAAPKGQLMYLGLAMLVLL